jgi:twitching motility protein PilT
MVTIEDPIEYLFTDKKSFVNQREIGIDVPDFHQALKHVVRQDPDVILVGEMRDYVSFDAALMASETGHLVFATIHASSAPQCIGRLLDLFPTERQPLIRQSLAFNLRAILCQRLLPAAKEGMKMVPAVEVLFNSSTAQKVIMNGEDKKLADLIRASKEEGMQDLNMSLIDLINKGLVTKKIALQYSPNPEQLKMNMQGIFLGDDHRILG